MTAQTFRRLATSELAAAEALRLGALVIHGSQISTDRILHIIDVAAGKPAVLSTAKPILAGPVLAG